MPQPNKQDCAVILHTDLEQSLFFSQLLVTFFPFQSDSLGSGIKSKSVESLDKIPRPQRFVNSFVTFYVVNGLAEYKSRVAQWLAWSLPN